MPNACQNEHGQNNRANHPGAAAVKKGSSLFGGFAILLQSQSPEVVPPDAEQPLGPRTALTNRAVRRHARGHDTPL